MNRIKFSNRLLLLLASIAFVAWVLAISSLAGAQGQPTFKVGDRVEADPLLIGQWRKATVIKVYTVDGRVNGYEVKLDSEGNRSAEEYTVGKTAERGIRPLREPDRSRPSNDEREGRGEDARAEPSVKGRATTTGGCATNAVVLAKPKANDPMELAFKRTILGNHQKRVEEKNSLSSPLAVGINFDSFQVGQPRVNQRTLDRTDGTYMRSAPVGANIYPVKTKFTLCEHFRGEIIRTVIDGRYECFKNNLNEWACGNASGWKTLETNRERVGGR